jgi:hypothetical protein
MNIWGLRKFDRLCQSSVRTILLLSVLAISLLCNAWQYRLIKAERGQTIVAERMKAERDAAEADERRLRRVKQTKESAATERLQQLYREIENLSEMNGRLLAEPLPQPTSPNVISSLKATDGQP